MHRGEKPCFAKSGHGGGAKRHPSRRAQCDGRSATSAGERERTSSQMLQIACKAFSSALRVSRKSLINCINVQ